MSEPIGSFVARRKPAWTELETLLTREPATVDDVTRLFELYTAASHDLAVAQKYYTHTDVQRFLNQLCTGAWRRLYAPGGGKFAALREFYAHTWPALVRQTLPLTKLCAALLLLGAVSGFLTVTFHPDGEQYLVPAELRAYIAQRGLWTDAALAVETPTSMAVAIFLNNLRVMLLVALLGITLGAGTVAVTVFNGLFVGALLAACFRAGLGWNLLTFMSAHGPVELSLICISGAAGLHVARALVDPGEQSRRAALAAATQLSVRLVAGAAPFVVAIGIVEGFVSPGGWFPTPLKLLTGAATGFGFWRWLLRG